MDSTEFELQSLLGQQGKVAKDATATATVSDSRVLDSVPTGTPTKADHHKYVEVQVSVTGMHCSSCSTAVEKALKCVFKLHCSCQHQYVRSKTF